MCGGGRGGRGGSIGRQWVMGAVFGVGGMSGDCVGVGHRLCGGAEVDDVAIGGELAQEFVHMPAGPVEFVGDGTDGGPLDRVDAAVEQAGFDAVFGDEFGDILSGCATAATSANIATRTS